MPLYSILLCTKKEGTRVPSLNAGLWILLNEQNRVLVIFDQKKLITTDSGYEEDGEFGSFFFFGGGGG